MVASSQTESACITMVDNDCPTITTGSVVSANYTSTSINISGSVHRSPLAG